MSARLRSVLHLVGSPVDEFHAELSRLYADGCLSAVRDPMRYRTTVAYVSPDGQWRFPADLSAAALTAAPPMDASEAMSRIAALGVDVVVPQMFCLPGMTTYRSMFDALEIPYVGNRGSVMAATADKARTRDIVAAAGVPVPAGRTVRDDRPIDVPYPVVVKPSDADNSDGVSLVRDAAEYGDAVRRALAFSSAALVETYVEAGREVRCGIVVRHGELICLPLEEYAIDPATKPIRGRDDKLARSAADDLYLVAKDAEHAWIVPADDPVTERVWALARRCHVALGCRHYSLFDFRIDPAGNPWFLEAGLYCSFSASSVIAVMAAAAGTPVDRLFADALAELDSEEGTPACASHH
ncbi:D-alanine--D-alanine ligase family protein [Mycolicibacterium arenosum]|uniref:D-alanine--D-alanine ligase n=1 Tax=Mycolicibacterium arenosum TaxID=2952157 RepID=A0ABT1M7E3_9MYCO|nr:D-alanine--D-alanine ligase [Mycolicibacterium sp. CAU 1645]MCP9273717.1 D-alanine--D-alanine ligase [Mycolicibacterium sp. CAU 1645]